MKAKTMKPVSNEVTKNDNQIFIEAEKSLLNSLKEIEFVRAKATLLKKQITQDLKLIKKFKSN